jgi:1-acyl-sn-glycerol-3-phosphate acyltransferase
MNFVARLNQHPSDSSAEPPAAGPISDQASVDRLAPLDSLDAAATPMALVRDQRVPMLPVISQRAIKWARWGTARMLRKHFSAVRISLRGLPPDLPDKPVLLYCNHPSIWTPSVGLFLATRLWPSWRHYAPANQQWIKHRHLPTKAGFFPIGTGRRGVRQFMEIASNVLSCPGSMLWMGTTPGPTDARFRPVPIHSAIIRLAQQFDDITLLPVAIEHAFTHHPMPHTLVRIGEPLNTHDAGRRSQEGWRTLIQRRLQMTMDRLAEEASSYEAHEFRTLL